MNEPKYDVSASSNTGNYIFKSVGDKGEFTKLVAYTVTSNPRIYNLGFGDLKYDYIENKEYIDDTIATNNGDMRIVLATVAHTAYDYTEKFPDIILFFRGSDSRRTNLYKRAINQYYEELSKTFVIFGAIRGDDNKIKNVTFDYSKDFDGFLFKRK